MGTEKLENSIFLPSTEQNVSAIKIKLFKMRFSLIKKKKDLISAISFKVKPLMFQTYVHT